MSETQNSPSRPPGDLGATALVILLCLQAMMVQIILIRESLIIFQGNELCFGVVFAAWLLGIAVGAGIGAQLAESNKKPGFLKKPGFSFEPNPTSPPARGDFVALALILIMAVLPLAQVYLIRVQRLWLHVPPGELAPFTSLLWSSLLTISPFSALVGFVFPFAYRLFKDWAANPAAAIGRLYVLEANGSVVGGITFTFSVAGKIDAFSTLAVTGLALCLVVLAYTGEKDSDSLADSFLVASTYLTVLLGALLMSGFLAQEQYDTVLDRWGSFSRSLTYITSKDSRYENLVLARQGKQFSLYGNGQYMFSFPDEPTYAEQAGRVLTEHPNPKRVLLIGGGVGGLLRQMLLHPVERLDYVELDPALIDLVAKFLREEDRAALRDPRVHVINKDGRYFVKHAHRRYDLIFVNLPDPATAMVNRFYTQDFFREAKAILEPDGVLATHMSSVVGYLGGEAGPYVASLDRTLRSVFKYVIASPGDVNYFFACDTPNVITFDLPTLMQRYKSRHIKTKFFSEYVFMTLLQPEMVESLAGQLKAQKDVPINTDFHPVTYFYNLRLWDRYAGGQLASFYRWARGARFWWVALIVGVFLAGRLGYVTLTPGRADRHRRFNVLLVIFCAGLAGLSWELILIFMFQNIHGYVYERVGLIIAAFMVGLVIGGAWSNRRKADMSGSSLSGADIPVCPAVGQAGMPVPPASPSLAGSSAFRLLSWLTLAIALYSCLLPFVLWLLAHVRIGPGWLDFSAAALMVLIGIAGFLTGAPFPLASRLHLAFCGKAGRAAGLVDSMDHLGAFAGALFTGVLFIPLLGIIQTSLAIALVNTAALALLMMSERKLSSSQS